DDDGGSARDPAHVATAGFAREADWRRGAIRARRLRRGRVRRVSLRYSDALAPTRGHRARAVGIAGTRAAGDRAPVRAARHAALHAGRGWPRIRRDARAHPADREQHAEEARVLA